MATRIYTGTWSNTYNGATRKFRGWLEYDVTVIDNSNVKFKVTSVGIQKISSGTTEVMSSRYGNIKYTLESNPQQSYTQYGYKWGAGTSYSDWVIASPDDEYTVARGTTQVLTVEAKMTGAWSGTSTITVSIDMPARADFIITYNGVLQGASNVPTAQDKESGVDITVSDAVPVCSGYTFLGWSTSSGGTKAYSPGGTFNTDADTTLYAVWYKAPTFTNKVAFRTSGSGSSPEVDNTSQKGFVKVTYASGYNCTMSALVTFGETPSVPTMGADSIYAYSGATGCPLSESTSVAIDIEVTDKANNVYSYSLATFISPSEIGIDLFKRDDGLINIGIGVYADESYASGDNAKMTVSKDVDFKGGVKFDSESLADFITEQGTSGDWYYRKWNSGKCEAWYSKDTTLNLSTSVAGAYSTSSDQTTTLPFSLSNAFVQATTGVVASYIIASASGNTLTWRPFRGNSRSDTYRISFYIIGNI